MSSEQKETPVIKTTDLERLIEAFEKSQAQVLEMLELMKSAIYISMEPIRDRLERIEKAYDLKPARPTLQTEEEGNE